MLIFYYYNNNDKEVSVFVASESLSESRFLLNLVFTRCFIIVLLHGRESPKTSIHEIKFLVANMLEQQLAVKGGCVIGPGNEVLLQRVWFSVRLLVSHGVTCEPKEASSHAL